MRRAGRRFPQEFLDAGDRARPVHPHRGGKSRPARPHDALHGHDGLRHPDPVTDRRRSLVVRRLLAGQRQIAEEEAPGAGEVPGRQECGGDQAQRITAACVRPFVLQDHGEDFGAEPLPQAGRDEHERPEEPRSHRERGARRDEAPLGLAGAPDEGGHRTPGGELGRHDPREDDPRAGRGHAEQQPLDEGHRPTGCVLEAEVHVTVVVQGAVVGCDAEGAPHRG